MHQTYDIILRIKRYFRCLWMALTGRNPYAGNGNELYRRLDGFEKLKESYCAALDLWEEALQKVRELSQSNAILESQVNDMRNLVEKLRERIRDKERIIDEYEKSHIYNKVYEKKD